MTPRILIVGGYGAFGARAAERLARSGGLELIIAGRSEGAAKAYAAELVAKHGCTATAAAIDATTVTHAGCGGGDQCIRTVPAAGLPPGPRGH
jgi:short-subunit dehydrogenase